MHSMDKRRNNGGPSGGGHHHGYHNNDKHDHSSDGGRSSQGGKYDDPPNSRLFIVCGKQITEEQFRESFGLYGKIEEVWVLKDRVTGEPKGDLRQVLQDE